MQESELIDDVMRRGGLAQRSDAERAVRATLTTLGERLTREEAQAVATALPSSWAGWLLDAGYDGDFDAAELYERVRRREGTSAGFAREHAQVVVRALGDRLADETRRRLEQALPGEVAELLRPAEVGAPPPHAEARHAPRLNTLATGRPGSAHPLSEARPPEGQSHSVVREDNPHGESKLSSARGLTQERLGDSLATGRPPGPARPLSEAADSEGENE